MEIFQKLGERAKEIGEKAKDIGGKAREVTRRSTELLEVTKMKFDLSKLEKEMENNLAGLGALVYQQSKGEEGLESEIERLCQVTRELEANIKSVEEQIAKLQPKPITCPQCSAVLPEGGKYCSYCGLNVVKD